MVKVTISDILERFDGKHNGEEDVDIDHDKSKNEESRLRLCPQLSGNGHVGLYVCVWLSDLYVCVLVPPGGFLKTNYQLLELCDSDLLCVYKGHRRLGIKLLDWGAPKLGI